MFGVKLNLGGPKICGFTDYLGLKYLLRFCRLILNIAFTAKLSSNIIYLLT